MSLLGVHNGNSVEEVCQFESWLGRHVDFHSQHTGEASWDDFDGSIDYVLGIYRTFDRPMLWSIPLIPGGASLFEASIGNYNSHYTTAARKVASSRTERIIYVRTGWEFNGNWMKWASKDKETLYINAFRHFATCFRKTSTRFRLVWCPASGQADPLPSYPGTEFVDVVGLDFYHQPRWDPKDADDAWHHSVTRPFGLQWHLQFSRQEGKPLAYPEWGVCSNNFGQYVRNAAAWFSAAQVAYHSYWNSNADYAGRLSNNQYPETSNSFRSVFG
jgi:hypothetical protein